MKWLAIIVIVLVVAAVLWLRSTRQGPSTAPSDEPHRLDDSVTPTPTPPATLPSTNLQPNVPSATGTSAVVGADSSAETEEPGSDFAWEPENNGDEGPELGSDPHPPEGRPGA